MCQSFSNHSNFSRRIFSYICVISSSYHEKSPRGCHWTPRGCHRLRRHVALPPLIVRRIGAGFRIFPAYRSVSPPAPTTQGHTTLAVRSQSVKIVWSREGPAGLVRGRWLPQSLPEILRRKSARFDSWALFMRSTHLRFATKLYIFVTSTILNGRTPPLKLLLWYFDFFNLTFQHFHKSIKTGRFGPRFPR